MMKAGEEGINRCERVIFGMSSMFQLPTQHHVELSAVLAGRPQPNVRNHVNHDVPIMNGLKYMSTHSVFNSSMLYVQYCTLGWHGGGAGCMDYVNCRS